MNLADHTTIGLGGPARHFVRADTEAELIEAVSAADGSGEPVLILGGGSNLVVADEGFDGTVIQVATVGITQNAEPGLLTAAAGEEWDAVVAGAIAAGLSGLECLSGIPGLAGATPIQNVGAYGQEVAQVITEVRAYDRKDQKIFLMPNERCDFGYRTSVFRAVPAGSSPEAIPSRGGLGGSSPLASTVGAANRHLVLGVTFRLAADPLSAPVSYPELAKTLGIGVGERAKCADVRSAVLELRRRKGMVIDPADPDTRSVGSFFVNPVLDAAALARVEAIAWARWGEDTTVPRFSAGDGIVKVPAAWLIERAGFGKGYDPGNGARISAKHTLALVNSGSASTAALIALARQIRDGVRESFGVSLSPEPVLIGVTL
ncbi:MAG: UDP-N-acetylmuramate dehydrogenase [Streptosporangiaceae bacterium]